MKRILPLLLCLLMLLGCGSSTQTVYEHPVFTASLPEPFEPVSGVQMICFAPYGDPLLSSSITFSATELNWYFDRFTDGEYESALKELCGYDSLTLLEKTPCKVDGYDAYRVACKVDLEQGTHDLILYAIAADRTYFFTLLNREGDAYIGAFDAMMQSVRFKEAA